MAYPQGASPVQPILEAVQELKIETSSAPAEFTAAGNVQVISKSGTNEFHGGAFWMYNGRSLNARNFFAAEGRSASTIISRLRSAGPSSGTSCSSSATTRLARIRHDDAAAKQSAALVEARQLQPGTQAITDPTTGQPFPGNMIPANRISPVSQNSGLRLSRIRTMARPERLQTTGRRNIPGSRDSRTTIITISVATTTPPTSDLSSRASAGAGCRYGSRNLSSVPGAASPRTEHRSGLEPHISPAAVNEFRFGRPITATTMRRTSWEPICCSSSESGVPTTGVKTGPNFNITGVTPWNPDTSSNNYQDNPQTTLQWIDNLSWTRGRHFLKFGFDVVRDRFNGNNIGAIVYGHMTSPALTPGSGMPIFCWAFRRPPHWRSRIQPSPAGNHLGNVCAGSVQGEQPPHDQLRRPLGNPAAVHGYAGRALHLGSGNERTRRHG